MTSPRTLTPKRQSVDDGTTDQRVVLHNVSWAQYEAITEAIGDSPAVRTTYLEGELEIMSPGRKHAYVSAFLGRLVEAFADARCLPLNGFVAETHRERPGQAGLEPDEGYRLGHATGVTDLAIEVCVTSGSIDKLEVYARLGVREVWFWKDDELSLHCLGTSGTYKQTRRSRVLRGFPVSEVERIIRETDPAKQGEAVRAFRRSLES